MHVLIDRNWVHNVSIHKVTFHKILAFRAFCTVYIMKWNLNELFFFLLWNYTLWNKTLWNERSLILLCISQFGKLRLFFKTLPMFISCAGSYRSQDSSFLIQILYCSLRIYFFKGKMYWSAQDQQYKKYWILTPIRSYTGNETWGVP